MVIIFVKQTIFNKIFSCPINYIYTFNEVLELATPLLSEYWILKGRASVKEVHKGCRTCRKWAGGPYRMPSMPPIPSQRVTQSHPFTHTGLDYLGSLYIQENSRSQKVWVCLFMCLVVRAVHLEHDIRGVFVVYETLHISIFNST